MGKRVKVGGIDIGTDVQLAILAAIGVGGYLLYKEFGGTAGTTTANTSGAITTAPADLAAEIAAGNGPSYDATQYASWASTILTSASRYNVYLSDSASVLAIVNQLDNLADVYSLIQAFGTHSFSGWFGAETYDLPSFLNAWFSTSAIASFNQQLVYNNVAYTF